MADELEPRAAGRGAALFAVLLLAAVLRFWNLHALPLVPDEVWEVTHNTPSLVELVHRVEGFPPLHGFVLGGLLELTGRDEMARVLSAVCGVGAVALAAWMGGLLAGPRLAFWGSLFVAVSPYHLQLSRSGRGYSLYVLLATLAICLALRLRKDSRAWDWFAFAAASWAVVATSYLGGLLVAMLTLLLAIGPGRHAWRPFLATVIGLAIACLPIAWCLWIDLNGVEEDFFHQVQFDKEAYAFTYLEMITGSYVGPSVDELSSMSSSEGIRAMAPWAAAAFLPALVLAMNAWKQLDTRGRLWLGLLVVATPLVFGAVSSYMPTGYGVRYIAWMLSPGTLLLAAGAGMSYRRPVTTLTTAGLLTVNLLGTYNRAHDVRYRSYDFRPVDQTIVEHCGEAPILAAPPYLAAAVGYHFKTPTRPVIGAFATTLLDTPNEHEAWRSSLFALKDELGDSPSFALVLQATAGDDQRSPTLQRFAKLLNAESLGRPCPRVEVLRVTRESLDDAIETLGIVNDDQ